MRETLSVTLICRCKLSPNLPVRNRSPLGFRSPKNSKLAFCGEANDWIQHRVRRRHRAPEIVERIEAARPAPAVIEAELVGQPRSKRLVAPQGQALRPVLYVIERCYSSI